MRMLATLAFAAMSVSSAADAADPVELKTFVALPRPAPTAVLQYGAAASQAVDLFLPSGAGLHPLAIFIHGGCWKNLPAAGREQLRHIGGELAKQGIAVWSIGYRRADEAGGGYPGTFQDVGAAIDRIRSEAARYHLDLSRTVVVGHSAGGQSASQCGCLYSPLGDQLGWGRRPQGVRTLCSNFVRTRNHRTAGP
jgi:acetyl esterase/lipase